MATNDAIGEYAEQVLQIASNHTECSNGRIENIDESSANILLDFNVEMPLHMKADGVSASGVRTSEPVKITIDQNFPWDGPTFYLRKDFPRHFPHLHPGSASSAPRPCIVDGSQSEFFVKFGLVESGIFHLLEQLVIWFKKAALGTLIDPKQGWEPMLRTGLKDAIEINEDKARLLFGKSGGLSLWQSKYYRTGLVDDNLSSGSKCWLQSSSIKTPLKHDIKDETLKHLFGKDGFMAGNTITAIICPEKQANGELAVHDQYYPETVTTVAGLHERARDLGCERQFARLVSNLERYFKGFNYEPPIPIGIVFCVQRPFPLIGSASDIELLPYVVELRASKHREILFAQGDNEPVAPAVCLERLSNTLLRRITDSPKRKALSMLGCGSLGSKLTLHAARSGQTINSVCDKGIVSPHNFARHALYPNSTHINKASGLAELLKEFGQNPKVCEDDLTIGLKAPKNRRKIIPSNSGAVVNSTASLAVRDALDEACTNGMNAISFETALFGRGRGAYLLRTGKDHNPNHNDLMAELYVRIQDTAVADLMFDPELGLAELQIGQGCGSVTMPMDDARLSAMSACLSEEISKLIDFPIRNGQIIIGLSDADNPSCRWQKHEILPFETLDIEGTEGWKLRIAPRVIEIIKSEKAKYPVVETGGILIGIASARLRTVTVVDVIDAPPDSKRSAGGFVLGTEGLHDSITTRHVNSGNTLIDVGTWHSHLEDHGPSPTDWKTAHELAAERTPPSVLLISTPQQYFALSSDMISATKK